MTQLSLNGMEQLAHKFINQHPGLENLCISIYENVEASGLRDVPENQIGGLVRGQNHLIVFANNITGPGQFHSLLRHEAFSHYAIDCLPPAQRQKLYDDMTRTLKNDPQFYSQYIKTIEQRYGSEITNDNIEEYFASIAEDKVSLTFSDKLIGKVREILKAALDRINISLDFNHNDVKFFIHDFIKSVGDKSISPSSTRTESMALNSVLAPSKELLDKQVLVWRQQHSTPTSLKPKSPALS